MWEDLKLHPIQRMPQAIPVKYDLICVHWTVTYNGRRLYQYNEDEFSEQVLFFTKLFSNYKFTSKQREATN